MIATLHKIITDQEGESKITFSVPSSELINVVKLNTLWKTTVNLELEPLTEDASNED